jgi:hypothetical protein
LVSLKGAEEATLVAECIQGSVVSDSLEACLPCSS